MSPSLRALLAGLIDYAGLFPPAKLPLAEALPLYLGYREGPDAWMLGRFVCPAARLDELAAFTPGPLLPVSALGRGGASGEEFLRNLEADLADVAACRERHGGRVAVEVLEVRLPPAVLDDEGRLRCLLLQAADPISAANLAVFFEAGWDDPAGLGRLSAALCSVSLGRTLGLKLRSGGLDAAAFPPSERVADALVSALRWGVPFKATAGLHHPFPRWDAAVNARMHGFINLFAAGVLAHARGMDADQARELLDDSDPSHFTFDERGLRWREWSASAEEIREARRNAVLSFGSCSFDEPREDLRALGWL